ncbi:MAG: hypothetical protein FJ096_11155 [Deltaproteobacteria bacterium]|nr:hypothetical protein [Deltaproteobacteria bacterium]
MKRDELRKLTRDELFARAEALGVSRPAVLTQGELVDEIVKRASPSASGMRGWLGRARDLVAQVVAKGLHLPDAARLFRGEAPEPLPTPPPPLPTVTLAEIYAAQGHHAKAVSVLDQVIATEPSHPLAHELRETWLARGGGRGPIDAEPEPERETATEVHVGGEAASEAEPVTIAASEAEPVTIAASEAEPVTIAASEAEPITIAHLASAGEPGPSGAPEVRTTSPGVEEVFRDGVVAKACGATNATVAWELRPVRYARALAEHPEGELVVRVFASRSEGSSVRSRTTDVAVEGTHGEVSLDGVPPGAHVRVCVAWKSASRFTPLTVGPALTMPLS